MAIDRLDRRWFKRITCIYNWFKKSLNKAVVLDANAVVDADVAVAVDVAVSGAAHCQDVI